MGADAMKSSYDQNRKMRNSQLKKRKSIFGNKLTYSQKINLKKVTREEAEKYIEQLKKERTRKFKRELSILLVILLGTTLIFLYTNQL